VSIVPAISYILLLYINILEDVVNNNLDINKVKENSV
jgi:hypothetical protein